MNVCGKLRIHQADGKLVFTGLGGSSTTALAPPGDNTNKYLKPCWHIYLCFFRPERRRWNEEAMENQEEVEVKEKDQVSKDQEAAGESCWSLREEPQPLATVPMYYSNCVTWGFDPQGCTFTLKVWKICNLIQNSEGSISDFQWRLRFLLDNRWVKHVY